MGSPRVLGSPNTTGVLKRTAGSPRRSENHAGVGSPGGLWDPWEGRGAQKGWGSLGAGSLGRMWCPEEGWVSGKAGVPKRCWGPQEGWGFWEDRRVPGRPLGSPRGLVSLGKLESPNRAGVHGSPEGYPKRAGVSKGGWGSLEGLRSSQEGWAPAATAGRGPVCMLRKRMGRGWGTSSSPFPGHLQPTHPGIAEEQPRGVRSGGHHIPLRMMSLQPTENPQRRPMHPNASAQGRISFFFREKQSLSACWCLIALH